MGFVNMLQRDGTAKKVWVERKGPKLYMATDGGDIKAFALTRKRAISNFMERWREMRCEAGEREK